MKQTAVEWLIDKFDTILPLDFNWDKLEKVFEQAKEIEKQQIMDAYIDRMDCTNKELVRKFMGGQYYNDTFKKD